MKAFLIYGEGSATILSNKELQTWSLVGQHLTFTRRLQVKVWGDAVSVRVRTWGMAHQDTVGVRITVPEKISTISSATRFSYSTQRIKILYTNNVNQRWSVIYKNYGENPSKFTDKRMGKQMGLYLCNGMLPVPCPQSTHRAEWIGLI